MIVKLFAVIVTTIMMKDKHLLCQLDIGLVMSPVTFIMCFHKTCSIFFDSLHKCVPSLSTGGFVCDLKKNLY